MEFSDITRTNVEKVTNLPDKNLVLAAYQYYNHQTGDAVNAELTVRQLKVMSELNKSTTQYSLILIWLTVGIFILATVTGYPTIVQLVKMLIKIFVR